MEQTQDPQTPDKQPIPTNTTAEPAESPHPESNLLEQYKQHGPPSQFDARTTNESTPVGEQLSRWPMVVLATLLGIAIITIIWGYVAPKPVSASPAASQLNQQPKPGKPDGVLGDAPDSVMVGPQEAPLLKPPTPEAASSPSMNNAMATIPAPEPVDYAQQAQLQRQMQLEQEATQREAERQAQLQKSKEAPTTVYMRDTGNRRSAVNPDQANPSESNTLLASNETDSNQTLKGRLSQFEGDNYLPHTRQAALSPYQVSAGTIIPAVMLSGINSDLPGQLIAQVVQNVYDSATGRYLLIPQGARLVGTYDNRVNVGQKRVLIAWNRIIYPDSSSIDLESMPGQDQSGYAGFKDKANSHVWPAFRNALLLSAITAGVQLSQPRAQSGDYSYSSQQMVAGALGMQMNQLGISNYQSRANMAPTLTIRPGYRFNVMVSKDMVIPPWQQNAQVPANNSSYQTVARW